MQKTQDMWVQPLGWEDPLEDEMATYSSILAWRIPWILEGYSLRGHKESNTTEVTEHTCTNSATHTCTHTHTHMHTRTRRVIISLLFFFLN